MPKHKGPLGSSKRRSKAPPNALDTADDYLAAGVSEEEGGGKWRAGDAAKSLRFFNRALDLYAQGLRSFPASFDLAYNKARLLFELTQEPRFEGLLPASRLELLQESLQDHRRALGLKEEPDALFNTAQVLVSLAESVTEEQAGALQLYQEALTLFQRCFAAQSTALEESERAFRSIGESETNSVPDDEAVSANDGSPTLSEESQWATVVEPTTKATLFETLVAEVDCLAAICGLVQEASNGDLSSIGDLATKTLEASANYAAESDVESLALSKANLLASYADLSFRNEALDVTAYWTNLETAFGQIPNIDSSLEALCDRAEALTTFNGSLFKRGILGKELAQLNSLRWKALSQALDDFLAASKLVNEYPTSGDVARIHLRRGDCECWRHRMAFPPSCYEPAMKSCMVLLKNAETYYRGAGKAATAAGAHAEESEARVKEALMKAAQGDKSPLVRLVDQDEDYVTRVIQDMAEDGMIVDGNLHHLV